LVLFVNVAVIANMVRARCKEKGVSVKATLEAANVDKGFIYDTEKRGCVPLIETVGALADVLDCSIDYLVGRTDNSEVNR